VFWISGFFFDSFVEFTFSFCSVISTILGPFYPIFSFISFFCSSSYLVSSVLICVMTEHIFLCSFHLKSWHSLEQYHSDLHLEQRWDATSPHEEHLGSSSNYSNTSEPYNFIKLSMSFLTSVFFSSKNICNWYFAILSQFLPLMIFYLISGIY